MLYSTRNVLYLSYPNYLDRLKPLTILKSRAPCFLFWLRKINRKTRFWYDPHFTPKYTLDEWRLTSATVELDMKDHPAAISQIELACGKGVFLLVTQ